MNNVVRPEQWWRDRKPPNPPNPPDPPDMDLTTRVAKLETLAERVDERLSGIDVRLAKIEASQGEFTRHYATKADLTSAKNSIILWVVGAVFLAQLLPAVVALIKVYFPGGVGAP